jgi:hypothetical protein
MHRTPENRRSAEAERRRAEEVVAAAMQIVVDQAIAEGVCQRVVQAFRRAIFEGRNEAFLSGVAHAALVGTWPDRPCENTREHAEAMVA